VAPGRDAIVDVSSNLATSFGHVNVPALSLHDTQRHPEPPHVGAQRQQQLRLPWDWNHFGLPVSTGGGAGLDFLAPPPLQPSSSWPLPATTHHQLGQHMHVPTSVAIAAPFHHPTTVVPSSASSPPLSSSLSPPTTPVGLSTAYGLPAPGLAAPPPPAVPARPSPPLQAVMVAELADAEEAVRRRQKHLQQQRELLLQQLSQGKASAAGGHRSRDHGRDQQQLPAAAAKRRSSRRSKQPAPGRDSPAGTRPARKTQRKRSRSPAEVATTPEEDVVERQPKRRPPSPASRAPPPPPPTIDTAAPPAQPQPQLPSLHHFLRSLDVLPPTTTTPHSALAHHPQALPSPSALHLHRHPQPQPQPYHQHQGDQAWPQQYHQVDHGGLRGFPLNQSLPLELLPTTATIGAGAVEAHRRGSVELAALGRPWP
jgi:hypothetical protein